MRCNEYMNAAIWCNVCAMRETYIDALKSRRDAFTLILRELMHKIPDEQIMQRALMEDFQLTSSTVMVNGGF